MRQVRAGVQDLRLVPFLGRDFNRTAAPDVASDGVGADAAETVGDPFGIAERAEESLHARGGESGKEVLQVEAQKHRLAGVRGGEGHDGAAPDEAVGSDVDRDGVEDAGENLALQGFDARLRHLDQPDAAGALAADVVTVMLECRIAEFGGECFQIREPFKIVRAEREPRLRDRRWIRSPEAASRARRQRAACAPVRRSHSAIAIRMPVLGACGGEAGVLAKGSEPRRDGGDGRRRWKASR